MEKDRQIDLESFERALRAFDGLSDTKKRSIIGRVFRDLKERKIKRDPGKVV